MDGKEAILHLPALAQVPKLHAIQWQPGAGGALSDEIDRLGLGQMRGGTREEVRGLWSRLRQPRRLYISRVADVATRAEAEAFLAEWENPPVG
jgi:hypothetical protein